LQNGRLITVFACNTWVTFMINDLKTPVRLAISLLQTSMVVKYIFKFAEWIKHVKVAIYQYTFKIVEPIGSCHLSICLIRLRRRAHDTKDKLLLTFFSFFTNFEGKNKKVWKAGKGFHAFCFLFWNVTVCSYRFFF
jgi:hypothetical protein